MQTEILKTIRLVKLVFPLRDAVMKQHTLSPS